MAKNRDLFSFRDYKAYLKHRSAQNGARSGFNSRLAEVLGVQSSYLSQVLHGKPDLSPEQALRANDFLEHDSNEGHFFMLLLQRARAGTRDLQAYFDKQIQAVVNKRDTIKSRVSTNQEIKDEHRALYYSSPDFIAVHMALAIPGQGTVRKLSQSLGLPPERIEMILGLLKEAGLAFEEGREFKIGQVHMHLGSDSPFIIQHHANWRLEALRRLPAPRPTQLNYSGVFSLSKKDFLRLRENLIQVVQDNLAVVRPSPEEVTVCQMIDLIPLTEV